MRELEQGCPWCEGQVDWCDAVFPDDHEDGETCDQVACPQCGYSLDILSADDKASAPESVRALVAERWNRRRSVEWREALRYASASARDLNQRMLEARDAAEYWERKYWMMHRKYGRARLQRNVERAWADRFQSALQRCERITEDRQVRALVERTFTAVYGKGVRH